jgi:hypothetical protein
MSLYEKRVVLFLDLLGFRSLIKERRENDIVEALRISSVSGLQFRGALAADIDFRVSTFWIALSARRES